jgi:predicted DNA-binding transcriptional regulator AlpA
MTNPFRKHASGLFANHGGNIEQAMTYSMSLVDTLSGSDKVAATTAVMVLVNAAAAAFDAREPSPEKLVLLDLIRSEIDKWADDELEDKLASWASNELDIESSIDQWMDDNLEDRISNLDLVVRAR